MAPPQAFRQLWIKIFNFENRKLPAIFGLIFLATLLEGLGLALLLPLASLIFETQPTRHALTSGLNDLFGQIGITGPTSKLVLVAIVYILIIFLRAGILLARDTYLARFKNAFINAERRDLYEVLAHAPWPALSRLDRSEILNSLTTDLGRLANCVHFFFKGIVQIIYIIGFLCVAFLISGKLTALVCVSGLFLFSISSYWFRKSLRLGEDESDANREVMFETNRFLAGLKTAKVYGAEAAFLKNFDQAIESQSAIDVEFVLQQGRLKRILEILIAIILIAIFAIGLMKFDLSGPALLALGAIMLRMTPQILGLLQGAQQVINSLPAYSQAQAIISDLNDISDRTLSPINENEKELQPPIKFRSIVLGPETTSTEAPRIVIDNLELPKQGLVLVNGPSGAGKTTFAELFTGLRSPLRGTIEIGGTVLGPQNLRNWQKDVAYLPQEPFIFHGSIRDNLAWPHDKLDEDKAWNALKAANINEMVLNLPNRLEQSALDKGMRFSSGERQRLCLARTLLRDAHSYILDEPTANLDAKSEAVIMDYLRNLSKTRLVVLISHNANLLKFADQIITFSNGIAGPSQ